MQRCERYYYSWSFVDSWVTSRNSHNCAVQLYRLVQVIKWLWFNRFGIIPWICGIFLKIMFARKIGCEQSQHTVDVPYKRYCVYLLSNPRSQRSRHWRRRRNSAARRYQRRKTKRRRRRRVGVFEMFRSGTHFSKCPQMLNLDRVGEYLKYSI